MTDTMVPTARFRRPTGAGTIPSVGVLTWDEAAEAGPEVCGGKGHRLARLERYGFTVPRGGVIPASWYDAVMAGVSSAARGAVAGASADMAAQPAFASLLENVRREIEASTVLDGVKAEALRAFLDAGQFADRPMAVRSSATAEDGARASFAGIHHSSLHVTGADAIVRAALACYASLWTPRAVTYRRRMRFGDDEVRCAVALCEMVRAEGREEPIAAGVAFTCDPLTGRRDLIVVDAAAGLGDAVVSGAVNPCRITFRMEKGQPRIDEQASAPASVRAALLPPDRERELSHLLLRLHWALGDGQDPQDVEWAFDGRAIWLLQARPATHVRRVVLPIDADRAGEAGTAAPRDRVRGEAGSGTGAGAGAGAAANAAASGARIPRYWSTANIKDAVPGVVTMLSWSMINAVTQGLAFAAATSTGYALQPGVELTRRFRGRAYFDLTFMQWALYDALGVVPSEVALALGGHQPEIPLPPDPLQGPRGRRRMRARLRLMRRLWRLDRELDTRLRAQEALLRPWRARDLAVVPREELHDMLLAVTREHEALQETVGLANSAEGPWEQAAEAAMHPIFGADTRPLLGRLLAGTGAVTSAEHGYAIFTLAETARQDPAALDWLTGRSSAGTIVTPAAAPWRELPASSPFRAAFATFLELYGHRAVYEADLQNPRWAEEPGYILDQVRYALRNPSMRRPRDAARRLRTEAERELRQRAGWRAPIVFFMIRRLRAAMALRELAKSGLVAPLLPLRRLFLDIGRRLARDGHLDDPAMVWHLSAVDLGCWLEGSWDGRGARALAADRARQREEWLDEPDPPDVLIDDDAGGQLAVTDFTSPLTSATMPASASVAASAAANASVGPSRAIPGDTAIDGRRWTGIAAASGQARGIARIVRHPNDAGLLGTGDILVAPSTDPGWTPLFLRASAIVMETGGYLSHGAIVAREYGLPAVVNLPGILAELRDGDELLVDGDTGAVTRLPPRA